IFGEAQRVVAGLKGWRAAVGHGVETHHAHANRVGIDAVEAGDDDTGAHEGGILDPRTLAARHGAYGFDDGQVDGARAHQVHHGARHAIAAVARRGRILLRRGAAGRLAVPVVDHIAAAEGQHGWFIYAGAGVDEPSVL